MDAQHCLRFGALKEKLQVVLESLSSTIKNTLCSRDGRGFGEGSCLESRDSGIGFFVCLQGSSALVFKGLRLLRIVQDSLQHTQPRLSRPEAPIFGPSSHTHEHAKLLDSWMYKSAATAGLNADMFKTAQ